MKSRLILAASAFALSACGETSGDPQIERLESGVLYRNDGSEISTVDPHQADGQWASAINADMFSGLMRMGPDGEPAPGLAQSWTVSEDGLLWSFSLRDAVWSDGREITAEDVVYSLRRAVDPATLAAYGDVYAPILNAEAVMRGEAPPERLGVAAPDARTVEIRLHHPMPYLPDLLADSRAAIVPRHAIEMHGDDWVRPENIVVSGAYMLVERAVDRQTVLRRNPLYFDDQNTCFDEVFSFPSASTETATRRARAGELDIAWNVPASMLARVSEEMPGHVRVSEPPVTFYLLANTEAAPFDDVRVREALGIAIDRRFAFEEVISSGLVVANSLAPASLTAPYPPAQVSWAQEPVEARRARAVALLEAAGFGPDNPLEFEFAFPSGGAGDRAVPVMQNDWNSLADWVEVEIFGVEAAVHYQNLGAGEFSVALGGWGAVIRDTAYMLDVLRAGSEGNFARWSDPRAEQLMDEAQAEQDPERRASLLREAEQIALDAFALTPLFNRVTSSIVHPQITGWVGGAQERTPSYLLCVSDAATP